MLDPLSISIPLSEPMPAIPAVVLPTRKLLKPHPTIPDDYILEIDNSTLELFHTCARKAENYSVHSREATRDQSAQQFGRLFHQCEELRLRHGLSDAVKQRQLELISTHYLSHPVSPDDHRTPDRMATVLKAYNERYKEDGWAGKVMWRDDVISADEGSTLDSIVSQPCVEIGFSLPLCTIPVHAVIPYKKFDLVSNYADATSAAYEPFPCGTLHISWTGRIDAILRDSNLLWVVDHKTTSSGGRELSEAFRLASQTIGYTWAATQLLSAPVAGCIINVVLIRPPLKTSRGTQPREEFERIPYFYSPERLAEWHHTISHSVADFVSCLLRGFFPMTGPKSFRSPCVYCDYHSNCQLPRSQRSADLASGEYRDVTWNPLTPD